MSDSKDTDEDTAALHPLLGKVRYGTVHLNDGLTTFGNDYVTQVSGQVVLLQAETLGISKAGDHTWAIWVCNPDDRDEGMVIPGCKIRAVAMTKTRPTKAEAHQHCLVYGG